MLILPYHMVLPVFIKRLGSLIPYAALFIVAEMVLFCVIQLYSGESNKDQIIYWVIVAVICSFLAYGRFSLSPVRPL